MNGPKARQSDLIVETMGDETLVYDRRADRVHCLNSTVSLVWSRCDGQRDVDGISRGLSDALSTDTARDLTVESLSKLSKIRLLDEPFDADRPADPSRRRFAGRLARAAAVIPIIASIKAPLAQNHLRSCPNDCTGVADCTPCKKGNGNGPCNKVCCNGQCLNANQARRQGCLC